MDFNKSIKPFVIVIPARYDSSRFPGKPLIDLDGIPMIIRTYNQCKKSVDSRLIYVATDDARIKELCELNHIQVILTSKNCLTGTDRVAEVANHINAKTYINVQGDEPLFNPKDLDLLILTSSQYPLDVINGYTEISDEKLFYSPSTPKVVFRPDGRLLYMSRAAIPTNKEHGFEMSWRQVCAYAFPRAALIKFSQSFKKTPLEHIEDIEILRFLELGWEVRMIKMSNDSISIDCPDDAARAINAIKDYQNDNR